MFPLALAVAIVVAPIEAFVEAEAVAYTSFGWIKPVIESRIFGATIPLLSKIVLPVPEPSRLPGGCPAPEAVSE